MNGVIGPSQTEGTAGRLPAELQRFQTLIARAQADTLPPGLWKIPIGAYAELWTSSLRHTILHSLEILAACEDTALRPALEEGNAHFLAAVETMLAALPPPLLNGLPPARSRPRRQANAKQQRCLRLRP